MTTSVIVPRKMRFKTSLRDGNCLFNSVESFLEYENTQKKLPKKEQQKRAKQLRKEVIYYLAKSLRENEPTIRLVISQEIEEEKEYEEKSQDFTNEVEYLEYMSKNGEWGGQPEIIAIARILNRTVKVYHQKKRQFIEMGGFYIDDKPEIKLLYRGQHHYDFIVEN